MKGWPTPKAGICGMTARTSGRPIEKSTHLTTQVTNAEAGRDAGVALPSSAEVFHASRSLVLALVEGRMTPDTSGLSSGASLAKLDPDGLWLKTSAGYVQLTLDGSLDEYSQTWPRWGIVLDGSAYELRMSERRTDESGSLSWRTPDANCDRGPSSQERWEWKNEEKMPISINDQVVHQPFKQEQTWPTPQTTNSHGAGEHGTGGANLQTTAGGQLNPAWVSFLMNFPPNWFDLEEE